MSEKLTASLIKKLKPENVIYAEIAGPGAMGNAGGVMFYVMEKGQLNLYETNIFDDEDYYIAAYQFLKKNIKKFCVANGGFGNTVYAKADSKLRNDPENFVLFYTENGKDYEIRPSVTGVHLAAAAMITEATNYEKSKQARLFKLYEKSCDESENGNGSKLSVKNFKKLLTNDEQFKFAQAIFDYFETLRYTSETKVQTSPQEWGDALTWIFTKNKEAFQYGEIAEERGKLALQKFRIKYAIEKLGYYHFFSIIDDYFIGENIEDTLVGKNIKKRAGKLFEILDKKLGEKIEEKFSTIEVIPSGENNFRYPQIVDFSDAEHEEIIQKIMAGEYGNTEYYFRNYICHTDTKSLAKVLPAAFYVVQKANVWDDNEFYVAGDIINRAWERVTDAFDNEKLEEIIFKTYWQKIGDTWPMEHYFWDINFIQDGRKVIFEDSVEWLESLDEKTLEKLNPRVKKAVLEYRKNRKEHGEAAWHTMRELARIATMKRAEEVLDAILYHQLEEIVNVDALVERILLNPKPKKVGAYAVKRIAENYKCSDKYLLGHFTAACEGASEKDELAEIENFAKIMQKKMPEEKETIDAGLVAARDNVETAKFQQKCMKGFFKEFEKYPKFLKSIDVKKD